ncbi:MAG: hemerythrin domain-containing protein [Candidatus Obscuribacterales bacterium]|nr:hemerythrin domain-containing protein [Candidatus Obscuribacterales bacterium]
MAGFYTNRCHPPTGTTRAEETYQGVGAIETIMRGHGLLLRTIIIYDLIGERLAKGEKTDPALVLKTTEVIHTYLQNFHENMEERYIFKPMEDANSNAASIQELKIQHGTAYELTRRITDLAKAGKLNSELQGYLGSFGKMYRYHSAWEDTVIFPAFDGLMSKKDLADLGGVLQQEEKKILGTSGFASFVKDIAAVERQLGIYDPSKWTAKL